MKTTFRLFNTNVTQEVGPAQQSYIRGVTETIKGILASHNGKVTQKPFFRHWGTFSLNLKIRYQGSNRPTLFIPSLANNNNFL